MAKKKTKSTVKRLGSRYGRTLRDKLGKIERQQKKVYKCPYCSYQKVKRLSAGIWSCSKCSAKFTSKAYSVEKPPQVKSRTVEEEV